MKRAVLVALLVLWVAAAHAAPTAGSAGDADEACANGVGICPIHPSDSDQELDGGAPALPPSPPASPAEHRLIFFWGVGCPHCEAALPFLDVLSREATVRIERVEVRRDAAGRRRFIATMSELGAGAVGIPTFVVGSDYVVGYAGAATEGEVRSMIARGGAAHRPEVVRSVTLPLVGDVDPTALSLPVFTLLVGLVDGVNPCAIWVLLVLLSILVHVKSRKRLLLFGGTFVVASGIVYFVFMTAWIGVFSLVGVSRPVTIALGLLVLLMGLINLKELVWFKRGVALYALTLHRLTLNERGAKVLKAVSGVLLVSFGLLFLLAPGVLG